MKNEKILDLPIFGENAEVYYIGRNRYAQTFKIVRNGKVGIGTVHILYTDVLDWEEFEDGFFSDDEVCGWKSQYWEQEHMDAAGIIAYNLGHLFSDELRDECMKLELETE